MRTHARRFVVGALALAAFGCQNDFAPQSDVYGLRVLAVRPEPASGSPGATLALDMLVADHRPPVLKPDGSLAPPAVDIAWIGGCHNPPGRQYYACLPALHQLAAALESGTVPNGPVDVALGPNVTHFEETLPEDVLSAAPQLSTDPVHYGVSYVFFAVCTGKLSIDTKSQFPLACLDENGAAIGPNGFVIGFTTIYTYEDTVNQNPVLSSLDFDHVSMPIVSPDAQSGLVSCMTDDDCASVSFGHAAGCSAYGTCAPIVTACGGSACPGFRVAPQMADSSIESYSGGNEIIWASYYATLGGFDAETRLVVDRASGLVHDYSEIWKPPAPNSDGSRRSGRLWTTLNDERGGATWGFFDVIVQ
jgi:hypothetical protein